MLRRYPPHAAMQDGDSKTMRIQAAMIVLAVSGFSLGWQTPARAVGCISGGLAGALAGHMMHHGVLGAVGGCVAGHEYHKHHEHEEGMQRGPETNDQHYDRRSDEDMRGDSRRPDMADHRYDQRSDMNR
jgi:hypothetical protein